MTTHKRLSEARSTTFRRPRCECLACYDSGILSDADGLLSEMLADYDRLPDGRRFVGGDLALVCHCVAAFPGIAADGSNKRGGFRLSSGTLAIVETERGQQPIGAELPRDATRDLHRRRLERWKATETAMSGVRQQVADGQQACLQAMADARSIIRPVAPAPASKPEAHPW